MRILLIFAALLVIVMIGKRLLQDRTSGSSRRLRQGNMVRCEQCGTFVPESDATRRDGRWYCHEHRDSH